MHHVDGLSNGGSDADANLAPTHAAEDDVGRPGARARAQRTRPHPPLARRSDSRRSKEERDRRIVKEGRGFPAGEVAISIRCGITDVHKACAAAGVDLEYGEARVNGRALRRGERNAEILRLAKLGMNPVQISARLGIPRSSVRYVLDQDTQSG